MNVQYESKRTLARGSSDVWLTPLWLLQKLGRFDLDPCASEGNEISTCSRHYYEHDSGLLQPWTGRVWCNPPYGRDASGWLNKCALHENAVALVFARVDTAMFQDIVFKHAHSVLFIRGRLRFRNPRTPKISDPAGAPSCLIAFDEANTLALRCADIPGRLVYL